MLLVQKGYMHTMDKKSILVSREVNVTPYEAKNRLLVINRRVQSCLVVARALEEL